MPSLMACYSVQGQRERPVGMHQRCKVHAGETYASSQALIKHHAMHFVYARMKAHCMLALHLKCLPCLPAYLPSPGGTLSV